MHASHRTLRALGAAAVAGAVWVAAALPALAAAPGTTVLVNRSAARATIVTIVKKAPARTS